jgi:hypothetical protein
MEIGFVEIDLAATEFGRRFESLRVYGQLAVMAAADDRAPYPVGQSWRRSRLFVDSR